MSALIDPRERFIHRTALFLIGASALAAGLATLLHMREDTPHLLDLLLPGGFTLAMLGLLAYLWRRPQRLQRAIWVGFGAGLLMVVVPAWVYPIEAARSGGSLVETLPPMSAALLPLILGLIVFVRPRAVLVAATVAWLLVASPILGYLLLHPDELGTPRGRDMVMTLGPVMLVLLIYIPFHRGIERLVESLRRERARMAALAERDGLTGLYNRRASESLLANLLAEPDAHDALILFDIDRFKGINDTHGHGAGDEVLRQVARRCASVLRRDDLFARWGGEEFLVLVRGAHEEGIARVAEAMRVAISATPIEPAGTVTASFGVARFRAHDSAASWIGRADEALYAAKEAGRDRVVCV
jgi:diguanylate cyclase (GGDEF)-like protein